MTIHILLADDHPASLAGASVILNNAARGRLQVAAYADSTDAMFQALMQRSFDLLVTDFFMPGGHQPDGLTMLATLRQRWPSLPIVVLTSLREPCALGSILGLGVKGLISKRAEPGELARAASQAAAGRTCLCSDVQRIMEQRYTHKGAWAREATTALTEREQQVLEASRGGLSARKIAEQMQRSERSVQRQRRRAMEKLGLQADAELCHRP